MDRFLSWFAPTNGHAALTESVVDLDHYRELLSLASIQESRISQLEFQLEEQGWFRLDQSAGREFSRDALGKLVDLARVSYLKNPIINRAVEIGALYVWGQDLSRDIRDPDVKAVIDRFEFENRRTLTGQQASRGLEVELQIAGNVFLALFPNALTGQVAVRTVPMEEITRIVCNPQDRYEPWYYERRWSEYPLDGGQATERRAYHPDWNYAPGDRPTAIGTDPIRWDAPLAHIKVGAFPHWRWGVPEVYPALDWARAYKELLEDDATRSRALAKFALKVTTTGGKEGVDAAKAKLGTTLGTNGGGTETNPPPTTGATFIRGNLGADLEPIRIAGATLPTDHSRPARIMASAGLGVSDHFFDADVGNHATASTLDRPTELRFSERRQLWRDFRMELAQWIIDRDLEASAGLLPAAIDDEQREVTYVWPDLLERSVTERVTAIVDAATLRGQPAAGTMPDDLISRQLMTALGVDDIDGAIDDLAGIEPEPDLPQSVVEALAALKDVLTESTVE